MTAPRRLALLGSTGSIGRQSLDVVRWHPERFAVHVLVAQRASEAFLAQVREFRPALACLSALPAPDEPPLDLPPGVRLLRGAEPLAEMARDPAVDVLVVASSGTVGFRPTLAALEAGKPVALANKEALIMAGHLVTAAAQRSGAPLYPIDSEHSAIWQCLLGEEPFAPRVRRLLLTASGGAFRDLPAADLANVTPAQALRHPTWSMGPKITVDSATLLNKGLEVIEAHWLFGIPFAQIEVVIHHQSVIHSLVEFVDGSVKAQLGLPDMRLPIQYALSHPDRLPAPVQKLDLAALRSLTFADVDGARYPGLALAYRAGQAGGTYPTVLNAANEVAVQRFLDGEIPFLGIAGTIAACLDAHDARDWPDLDEVLAADQWARTFAARWHAT